MEGIYEQWRKDLIAAGKLKPDEDIDIVELSTRWQKWQMEQLRSGKEPSFGKPEFGKALGLETVKKESKKKETNIREGIKQALNALLTEAKGASYCMIVVERSWINFRYKRSKNNLHLQVAGNQYITPNKLADADIERLEKMGIPPEPMSVEIYARDFDDEPRDLDKIVSTAIEIFNEVYHMSDDDEAYLELDLGKGETEEILNSIAPFFKRRSGKKFKWDWNRST
ncbi:MAG: hypothetical protein RTV31_05375 [Candidatus Thorarchaeota archaeon]